MVAVPNPDKASALTPLECYQQYDGKASGANVSKENSLTAAQYTKFKNSDCAKGKDAPCSSAEGSSGYLITCKVAAKNQCKADYDGKDITDHEAYKLSGCGEAEGGPCKLIVQPPKPGRATCASGLAGNPDTTDESTDSSTDTDTGIGTDYDATDCAHSSEDLTADNCEVIDTVVLVANVLSGLAATVIVAMIIVGGIQYSMAGAEAGKVQAAKQKIINALLALMLLIFGFSIIQWLIPGGLI